MLVDKLKTCVVMLNRTYALKQNRKYLSLEKSKIVIKCLFDGQFSYAPLI